MAWYTYPLVFATSDGRLEFIGKTGKTELNQPTQDQQDQTPDLDGTISYYRKVADDSQKSEDWRIKLGTSLMKMLGGKEHSDREYHLKTFPEGYTLWENIKTNPKSKTAGKKRKRETDRQDTYLYGHPLGRNKRFRSPKEFLNHLIWLASDKTMSDENCSCRICSPDGDIVDTESTSTAKTTTEAKAKVEVQIPFKKESFPPSVKANIAPVLPTTAAGAARPTYQPAPATKSNEQSFDAAAGGKFIYRPGELLWFNNGANWRLGVVGMREVRSDAPMYLVQPLSNPLQHQSPLIKDQQSLRPWLAWSVPGTTVQSLRDMPFEQVQWDRVINGEFDAGQVTDYVVDGSSKYHFTPVCYKLTPTEVLAAQTVDASYSFFDKDTSVLVPADHMAYKGMFLGAEKIWVGEPVRLKAPGNKPTVQILQKMIENTRSNDPNQVQFVGDVYELMTTAYKSQSSPQNLPPRLVADLKFRNEIGARKGEFYEWRLIDSPGKKTIDDIKGRWYETQALLPILKGAQKYEADLTQGITSDAGEWMNGRKDNNHLSNMRKKNRKDTLGTSVPTAFDISRGLDQPGRASQFPRQQPAAPPTAQSTFDPNQYMDLDGGNGYYEN